MKNYSFLKYEINYGCKKLYGPGSSREIEIKQENVFFFSFSIQVGERSCILHLRFVPLAFPPNIRLGWKQETISLIMKQK
jgi:hypothetical protein